MTDVTQLLDRWRGGEAGALDELVPIIYAQLKELAGHYLRQERRDHTLQPTSLVHEVYLRLIRQDEPGFNNRVHFFGAAANIMRRILVDHARRRRAAKRGSGETALDLDQATVAGIDTRIDLLALDEALGKLAVHSPAPARVVELRYFGGLSVEETAAVLGVAPITVKRHWAFARVWLYRALASPDGAGPASSGSHEGVS